jgi:hypothetical protein
MIVPSQQLIRSRAVPTAPWHRRPGGRLAQGRGAIAGRVHRQAYTLAFGDVFLVPGALLLVAIVAVLLPKKPPYAAAQ